MFLGVLVDLATCSATLLQKRRVTEAIYVYRAGSIPSDSLSLFFFVARSTKAVSASVSVCHNYILSIQLISISASRPHTCSNR